MPSTRRLRIARTDDQAALRALLSSRDTRNARLELIFGDGTRHTIGRGLIDSTLPWLVGVTQPGSGARLELVFSHPRRDKTNNGKAWYDFSCHSIARFSNSPR